jgi:hypothetical protein
MARINFSDVVNKFLDTIPAGRVKSRNISGGYTNILKQDFEKGNVSAAELGGKILEALGKDGILGGTEYTERAKLEKIIKEAGW